VLLCSNNETLKVMDMQTGNIQQYKGHSDIVLCIDIHKNLALSGSKDNQIRLWKINENSALNCIAVF